MANCPPPPPCVKKESVSFQIKKIPVPPSNREITRHTAGLVGEVGAARWSDLQHRLHTRTGGESSWKWNDGSPFRYLNWLPGNPSAEDWKNCGSLEPNKNSKWENKECSKKLGYVCEKGKITSYNPPSDADPINCPPIWIPYAGYCYYLYKEAKAWQDAMVSCRKDEGDLASLHNVEESSFANSNFVLEGGKDVWLGLNDLKTEMLFEWSDGTPVTYTVWQRGEPSHMNNRKEDCVALNTTLGHWSDQACEKKLPYICKRKPLPIDHERKPIDEPGCSTANS
ncbi:hypothetical protein AB205_0211680 [Aquarana catesbeiana]|uniref:C-type lectin domain-containing protein n=1 Tax=Aquarana catesbeiana TaxID=8400 RepID=A0A2G9NBB6_AQUCT|nr:hypothetical protein AB205_0211680 [Aquarana catesbeiana]